MARSKLRQVAANLTKGAKALTDVARRIRALDALGASISEEQLNAAFSTIVGELRAFRATTLQQTVEALSPQESEASEVPAE